MADKIISGQRIRFYPTKGQIALAGRCFTVSRMVYNQALAQMEAAYRAEQKLSLNEVSKLWTVFRQSGEYQDVPRSVADQALRHLDAAYQRFFKSLKEGGKPAYPKPKGKFSPDHFSLNVDSRQMTIAAAWAEGRILLPGFGLCKLRGLRPGGSQPKIITVSRDALGRFWLSFNHERGDAAFPEATEGAGTMVGIDLGIATFATLSDGTKIANPRHLQRRLKALKRSHRALSRCAKKSNRSAKRKRAVALIHAQVAQARNDFIHKTATSILKRFDVVAVEDLNVQGMAANKRLARHIMDLGLGRFVRALEYKAKWYGRTVLKCGRWDPTSQCCSLCGDRGTKLPLSVRAWTCQKCGALHDRDENAAVNVLNFALGKSAARGGTEPPDKPAAPVNREPAFDHAEAATMADAALALGDSKS